MKTLVLPETLKIKPAYSDTECALFVGDCLELLPKFPEGYFDMIFADPTGSQLKRFS